MKEIDEIADYFSNQIQEVKNSEAYKKTIKDSRDKMRKQLLIETGVMK